MKKDNVIKHTFDNGLKLLIVPGYRSKHIWLRILVGAGSCREEKGHRGLSHLTEHLIINSLFDIKNQAGFKKVFFQSLEKHSAFNDFDYTTFEVILHRRNAYLNIKNLLFNFFNIRRFSPRSCSESKKSLDREFYREMHYKKTGRLYTTLYENAYKKHPYKWYTFGHKEDYSKLTSQDIFKFYRSLYIPNNTVAVVIGPVSAPKLIRHVEEIINRIKARKIPQQNISPESFQTKPRYLILKYGLSYEILLLGFKIPPLGHPLRLGLNALNNLILDNKLLVYDRSPILTIFGYLPLTKHNGLYEIFIMLNQGHHSREGENKFFSVVKKYLSGKMRPDIINSAKVATIQEHNLIKKNPGAFSKYLGVYELFLGNYSLFVNYINLIKNLSKEDLLLDLANTIRKRNLTAVTLKRDKRRVPHDY